MIEWEERVMASREHLRRMTKRDAKRLFDAYILPALDVSDRPAVREAWIRWTDTLQRDGRITSVQAETWIPPYR